jgi:prephenate dehydrogenase
MKKVGIIGYGRFGKVLVDLLSKEYEITIYDSRNISNESVKLCSLDEVLQSIMVFIAVPIRSFKDVVKEISQYKLYNTTIIDVCSVKLYPVEIMEKYLPKHVGILASHPHFGPDSYSPFK